MGDIELQIFSDRLKKLRLSLDMTQKDFAGKIGITASALSSYEKNLKNPSIAVAKKIAETFHVSIDWLCGLSDKRYIVNDAIWTYSDIINLCHGTENLNIAIDEIVKSFVKEMQNFIKESKHMEALKQDNLIDQELYDLWLEKELKKIEKPILLHYVNRDSKSFGKHFSNNEWNRLLNTHTNPDEPQEQ